MLCVLCSYLWYFSHISLILLYNIYNDISLSRLVCHFFIQII